MTWSGLFAFSWLKCQGDSSNGKGGVLHGCRREKSEDAFNYRQELALWRKSHGYKTQEDFAHLVGISHRKVQRLERGERLPAWEDIYRLKEFMGVEFEFFVTSEMERDKPHSGSKPMETRLNHLIRRLRMWYENSPYCEEKEDDMDTLEHLMGTIDRSRKNYK